MHLLPIKARTVAVAAVLLGFAAGCRTVSITEKSILAPIELAAFSSADGFQEFQFKSGNGQTINGIRFPNSSAANCLLYLHGSSGSVWDKEEYHQIKLFKQLGFDVFAPDYQGYGKSGGTASVANVYADSEAALRYVREESAGRPIMIYGFSLGSAAALRLGAANNLSGLILESAIDDPVKTAKFYEQHIKFPKRMLVKINVAAIPLTVSADAAKLKTAVLMLHGQEDETAPIPLARTLFQGLTASPKKLVEFPKARHNTLFETDSILYVNSIADFIKSK